MDNNRDLKILIQILDDRTSAATVSMETTWGELVDSFTTPQIRGSLNLRDYLVADKDTRLAQKDGIGWMPCSLRNGGRRRKDDVDALHLLVLDFDDGIRLDQIEAAMGEYEYLIHSSYSHSPELPRWRVVVPLAEPIAPHEQPALFDHVNNWFGGVADVACGHDWARFFYWPSCPPDAEKHFVHRYHAGQLFSAGKESASAPAKEAHVLIPTRRDSIDFEIGFEDGFRTRELTRRVGWCSARDMALAQAIEKCVEWNRLNLPPLDDKKVRDTCESIYLAAERSIEADEQKTERMIVELNEKCAWIERYSSIYRFNYGDFVNRPSFSATYANVPALVRIDGRPKVKALGDAWVRSPQRRQHRDVVYAPGEPPIFDDCVNFWRGWGCQAEQGDIKPWATFLDYIFAGDIDSRRWFEQWIAYPLQHPGAKLNCAVVMWSSRQGLGKTMIGETIGRLYGPENFKTISAAELHSPFNGWALRCQFVLGEENASSDHRADSNRLKHLITGETIVVNEKFQPAITLKNSMNFLFTSNHADAFFLETFDRRFFVWELTGEHLPPDFYADFVDWRDNRGGSQALMHHLRALDLSGFNSKAAAPMTRAKLEMIDTGRSDLERWLVEMRDDPELALSIMGHEIVPLDDLVKAYNLRGASRVNTTSVGKALNRLGNREKRRIKTKMGRPFLYAICRLDHWGRQENEAWAAEHTRPMSRGLLAA